MKNSQANFETAWAHTHDLVKLQIVEVKASFERSLTCIQHQFNVRWFDKLRGAISQTAMALMMPEINKVEDKVVNSNGDCVCPIRRTHGLPCAHIITPFKHDNLPIPLELIHDHWKTLSLDRKEDESIINLMRADFELFIGKVKEFNTHTQDHWRMKLKELLFPSTSSLKEPQTKAVTKGRKAGSLNKSMRRDPSYFEHVEASMKTPKSAKEKTPKPKAHTKRCTPSKATMKTRSKSAMKSTPREKGCEKKVRPATPAEAEEEPRKKPRIVKNLFAGPYVDQFPERIREFMHCTTDVGRDGNCGFRVISMFWNGSENGWSECRAKLVDEVQTNLDLYEKVTGAKGGAKKLCERLTWSDHHLDAPVEKWMSFPNAGHVIASAYNVAVVFLSPRQCLTFLPLRTCPPLLPDVKDIKVMAIALVDENHFVKVCSFTIVLLLYTCAIGMNFNIVSLCVRLILRRIAQSHL